MATFGKFVLGLILFVVSIVLTAVSVSTLWGWFVVPLGVKAIGAAHGYGLATLIHFFTIRVSGKKKDGVELSFNKQMAGRILVCLAALASGWVTIQFM